MIEKTMKNYGFYGILKWEGSLLIPSFSLSFPPLLPLPYLRLPKAYIPYVEASPAFGQDKIILLGERSTFVNNLPRFIM